MDKIRIQHPNSNKSLALVDLKDYYSDGFYTIISDEDKETLNYFLKSFEDFRKDYKDRIVDEKLYPNLPFSVNTIEWKERQKDIKIIDKIISNKENLNILDVGSWNGWLSNYLTKKGHNLVAVNMFTNAFDGLKTNKYYKTKFTSLQMISDDFYRIDQLFNVIILNRNWAFFTNKQKTIDDAKKMLSKDGVLIITGLFFYKNSTKIKKEIALSDTKFKKTYNISMFYNPSKGYLDFSEKHFFKENSISLYSYESIKNLIKLFFFDRPINNYGLYIKK